VESLRTGWKGRSRVVRYDCSTENNTTPAFLLTRIGSLLNRSRTGQGRCLTELDKCGVAIWAHSAA